MTPIISRIFACFLFLAGLSAAAAQKYPAPPPQFFQANAGGRAVLITAGDVLSVRFHYTPEMNKTVKVRDDGKISLDLFQGIEAAGETPEELQAKLVTLYSKEYTQPEITVDLDVSGNNQVFVTGEVLLPGAKELRGKLTVAMVLAMGQVNQKSAATKSIFLIRNTDKSVYTVYKLDGSFPGGISRNIEVAAGDILFVPRKGIVKADDFMEQYVRQLLPAAPNVSASVLFTPGVSNAVAAAATGH